MIQYSLCIEPILNGLDFYDRIPAAADLGFQAVEFWGPTGKDLARISRLAAENHLAISICCVKTPWEKPMDGPAEAVLANVRESLQAAQDLGCPSLIVLAGNAEADRAAQERRLVENLKRAAELAEKAGVTLNLEALNSLVDHPGYSVDTSAQGFRIVREAGSEAVKLLFDVYHMQVMEGNLIENITRNIDLIGHFHSAGVPGRHEHFSGELDYRNILKAIEGSGYSRYFGLEYWPSYEDKKSLQDVMNYLRE